jgi:hypothetical protein
MTIQTIGFSSIRVSIFFVLGFMFLGTACAPARWAEIGRSSSTSPPPNSSSGGSGKVKHVFDTVFSSSAPGALDITWVVDNSGSMVDNAATVRRNFSQFVSSLQKSADLRFALISHKGSFTTDLNLPLASSNFLQINQYVGSTDSLEITATAFCPRSPDSKSECGKLRAASRSFGHDFSAVAGALQAFLRPEAKKIFVFTTDDESKISYKSFLGAFVETWPSQSPAVFAFIGLGHRLSPCAVKEGREYENLIAATEGRAFNICDRDWTSSFTVLEKTIEDNLSRWVSPPIQLPANLTSASQISLITLEGRALTPDLYQIANGTLHINPEYLSSVNSNTAQFHLHIEYQ